MPQPSFEWDDAKALKNFKKHCVTFFEAQHASFDPKRVLLKDVSHSHSEHRFSCLGHDQQKLGVLTVRFTYRNDLIRIFGAGYWRKGKKLYEQANCLH